jgi:hypothetical protein
LTTTILHERNVTIYRKTIWREENFERMGEAIYKGGSDAEYNV